MLHRDNITSQFYISSYENESFKILSSKDGEAKEEIYSVPLLISSESLQHENLPLQFSHINREIFNRVREYDSEILLIGTGQTQAFPDKGLLTILPEYPFSVDFMDTGAACRTFNILVNENRRVTALLFLN